ncbi:MAG: GGDEF domain-containing protein [Rhodocyclaceae bacterium]|nr:GGDEF domain-containing protein [Rhodocyclaceae bacterium]MDZ4214390.1 GGDEF domain-containing protein [Rhodocyclaceae bacterium]
MTPLFQHLDIITRSRNRSEVEVAAVKALHELIGASRTELHKVFLPPGDILAGLSVAVSGTDANTISHDDGFSWPEQTGSIENYPLLACCLAAKGPCLSSLPNGQQRCITLIRNQMHEPYGLLQIERDGAIDQTALDLIEGFSAILSNSLGMLEYSETDTLTRLLNRKTFDEYLINILANIPNPEDDTQALLHLPHRRHSHPEARNHWLGVMDIDKFKSINDRFGHLIGDEVLILVANLMRESFRAQDKLFRFGGEEFVALLRPAEFDHAIGTFERFRKRVEAFEFPQIGHVTVSIGFTQIKLGDTPSIILDAADEALYWAKEHGRNQCHAYEVLIEEGKLQRHATHVSDIELF